MANFDLHILGCGSALPTTRHLPSAQVIDLRDKLFLIDCGEGTQLQMRRMHIRFNRIAHVFISHAHGDHCFGLPGLLSTLGMLGRRGDLFIHAPEELRGYVQMILDSFCRGMEYRVMFCPVDTRRADVVMEDRSVTVRSIPLKHRIPCCGFLFEEKQKEAHIIKEMIDFYQVPLKAIQYIKQGEDFVTPEGKVVPNSRLTRPAEPPRRYAYCSDTAFSPDIVPQIRGVDLLYHEATFAEADLPRARETYHSTARQAAEIACRAEAKRLIIGHYSARYDELDILRDEAQSVFPKTILAQEGMKVSIDTL